MVLAVGDELLDGLPVGRRGVHDPVGDAAGDDHGLDGGDPALPGGVGDQALADDPFEHAGQRQADAVQAVRGAVPRYASTL